MSNTIYSKILIPGSFLLPEVRDQELSSVINLVNQTRHPPLLAIAKEMAQVSFNVHADYIKKQGQLHARFKIGNKEILDILTGFRTPIIALYNCYTNPVPLFDFSQRPRPTEDYITKVIQKFKHQIVNCKNDNIATTGTRFFTHCEEYPYLTNNENYRLGVIASLTTFREFLVQLNFRSS